jgi:hypothetical protein
VLDLFDEARCVARRIDEDVSAIFPRARDEVAPRAEARLGGEAAEVDVLVERFGEGFDADVGVVPA